MKTCAWPGHGRLIGAGRQPVDPLRSPLTSPHMTSTSSSLISGLTPSDALSFFEAKLREAQESLANQLIERRLDQERIATLKLQIQELREQVFALRRALDSSNTPEPGRRASSPRRRRPRR